MFEDHSIVNQVNGEPLPAGCVGVRVRVRVTGCPSRRWSRDLGAHLVGELAGHTAVGHLRLNVNDIVQGDQIVLEGVERCEARALAHALRRAVDAVNKATRGGAKPHANMTQREADAVARELAGGLL